MERLHELRDLVLDHLDPRRLLHQLRQRVVLRRAGCDLVGLADHLRVHPIIGFCMSEILSAFPTAGGIYYWAAKMGGPAWGWFTGWFNLIGLIGVVASVDYACALFLSFTIWLFDSQLGRARADARLHHLPVPADRAHGAQHLPGAHPLDLEQHVGVLAHRRPAVIVLILIFGLDTTRASRGCSPSGRTTRASSTARRRARAGGSTSCRSAIAADPVHDHRVRRLRAPVGGDEGGVDGGGQGPVEVDLLLGDRRLDPAALFLFAATNVDVINEPPYGSGVVGIFASSLGLAAFKIVMIISTDRPVLLRRLGDDVRVADDVRVQPRPAIPGRQLWSKVTKSHAPRNATLLIAVCCAFVALPALIGNSANIPFAFFALAAVTVIGLYIAYAIPIYLRWRMGDAFVPGPWTLGNKYKWMAPIAVIEVAVVCFFFCAPFGRPASRATTVSSGTTATSTTRRSWSAP